jgi:hypothetical protein
MTTPKLILLVLVWLFALSGCNNPFRPKLHDVSDAEMLNSNPIELLNNLQRAYQEKNINLYLSLLHPEFRFELLASEYNSIGIDLNGDFLPDEYWGYEHEKELTTRMFRDGSSDGLYPPPDDISLRLQIPPQDKWEKDDTVGHEDWIIINCSFDLVLSYYESNSAFNANGKASFYLRPVGDRWYIAIWRDESYI